jgi:prepilin-type N-terminal cleavage/methylation domain-containing protein
MNDLQSGQWRSRKGFALLEILIVVAIILLLAGGGWYAIHLKNERSMVQTGLSAEQEAQQAVRQANWTAEQQQRSLNRVVSTTVPGSQP